MNNLSKPIPAQTRVDKRRARKETFIRQAAEVFRHSGLRATRLDDVAEHIGVAKVVLYRYFASKEELIENILQRTADLLVEADSVPWEGYLGSARNALKAARQDVDGYLVLMRHARYDVVHSAHHERVRAAVNQRLEQNFRDLGLDETLIHISADSITTFVLEAVAWWIEFGDMNEDEKFLEWLSIGTRSLDNGWRGRFTIPGATPPPGKKKTK